MKKTKGGRSSLSLKISTFAADLLRGGLGK